MYQFILAIKSLVSTRSVSNDFVEVSIVNHNGWCVEGLRLETEYFSFQRESSFLACLITSSRLLFGDLKVSQLKNC